MEEQWVGNRPHGVLDRQGWGLYLLTEQLSLEYSYLL